MFTIQIFDFIFFQVHVGYSLRAIALAMTLLSLHGLIWTIYFAMSRGPLSQRFVSNIVSGLNSAPQGGATHVNGAVRGNGPGTPGVKVDKDVRYSVSSLVTS